MHTMFERHSNAIKHTLRYTIFSALFVTVLASQVFASYRIPSYITLLPIGTPKADTSVFQSPIINDSQWAYFVYLPPTYDQNSSKLWPVYINVPAFNYSTGAAKMSDVFTTHLDNGGMAELLQNPAKFRQVTNRFICITPIVNWDMCSSIYGHPERLKTLFDSLSRQFKIDKSRINMSGYCFGAGVTYTFATFYPKYLSHIVLMAGNDNWATTFNLAKACSLKTIPIRQYADSVCSCNDGPTAKAAWTAINACGGHNDSITCIGTGWHEVWYFGGFDTATSVFDWMLSGPGTPVAPENEEINVRTPSIDDLTGNGRIEVVALNGKVLCTRTGSMSDITRILSTYNRGMYLLRTTFGNRLVTRVICNK
jgi:predicted esterase